MDKQSSYMHIIVSIYWILLLFWQVFRPVENRSIIDIGFKILMLATLLIYVILKSYYNKINMVGLVLLVLYLLTQVISHWNSFDIFKISHLIDLIFTACMVFTFIILNSTYIINRDEMIIFSKIIVSVVLVLCVYADVFQFGQIINALRTTTGYANAVSSMMASNHEFGLYLSFGILSYRFLISKSKGKPRNIIIYYSLMSLFFFNLILTFSRTALISMVFAALISVILMKKHRLTILSLAGMLILIILMNAELRKFFYDIVLRVEFDGNRGTLLEGGLTFFAKGSIFEKMFGVGQSNTVQYARQISPSSSFHNGYITILLNGGLSMILFLLIIIISNIKNGLKTFQYDKYDGAYLLAGTVIMLLFMWGQTPVIFSSDLVSSMLTFYCIIVPKYYFNYHKIGSM